MAAVICPDRLKARVPRLRLRRQAVMHIAYSALGDRILLGRVNKNSDVFVGEKHDVTSDVLQAVLDYVEPGYVRTVFVDGREAYEIEVRAVEPKACPERSRRLALSGAEGDAEAAL